MIIEKNNGEHGTPGSGTLITLGDYYGSLAAARCLGQTGIPVHFADHRVLVPGIWSKFVSRRVKSSKPDFSERYCSFLLEYADKNPGLFLYPTSDDMCWLMAKDLETFRKKFKVWMPSINTIYSLLNKAQLTSVADAVGVKVPKTLLPNHEGELLEIYGEIGFPILLKPRTQIGHTGKGKGAIVSSREELIASWRVMSDQKNFDLRIRNFDPNVHLPMVQKYHPSALAGIVSVAGIALTAHEKPIMLSSVKVFQRPRRTGVGIAFKSVEVEEKIAQMVADLITKSGYFGIFEAEFIIEGSHALLLDFNPRYYGQMAFEIARGLPLPLIAYHMACGNDSDARRLTARASLVTDSVESRFANSWVLRLLTLTQMLAANMAPKEWLAWQRWLPDRRKMGFDAVFSADDQLPFFVDILANIRHFLRHPRDFYRKFFARDI